MNIFFECLEETVNKSSITQIRNYLNDFQGVTKWMIFSDYCFDKNKPNKAMTYIIVPYIMDINVMQDWIQQMASTDLKHTSTITDEFCSFYQNGPILSISFLLDKKDYISQKLTKESIQDLIQKYLIMLNRWGENNPQKREYYDVIIKKFKAILEKLKRKNFNKKLFSKILNSVFYASYITYLLIREIDIEIIGWFSDTDEITTGFEGIAMEFYEIIYHNLCVEHLGEYYKQPSICYSNGDKPMFYEQLNRIADYICGFVAEYNLKTGSVSKEKYCDIAEKIVADNDKILIFHIKDSGVAKIRHKKTGTRKVKNTL